MEAYYRQTYAEIDVNRLRHNIQAFRQSTPAHVKLSLCVKANGYGHGAAAVAEIAEEEGVDYLNVAFLDEAIQLRNSGIHTPILILGYTPPEGIPTAFFYDITLNVYSNDVLVALEQFAPALSTQHGGRKLKVHVKIDSGMGRLGIRSVEEAAAYVRRLSVIEGVEVEGIFTHFACADECDKTYTNMQHARFQAVIDALQHEGLKPPIVHTSNSAASIDQTEYDHNMIRVGVSLYGLYPSAEVNQKRIHLEPVLSWKTKVAHVKAVPANEAISYGAHYVTQTDNEWIATLPVGYADGYSRMLSGSVEVLIRGKRVPVVGSICMDQCMISLSPLGDEAASIKQGEEVVLIGKQGNESILIDVLADKLGTIHYEVACMLAHRVPRVYMEDQHIRKVVNPLI